MTAEEATQVLKATAADRIPLLQEIDNLRDALQTSSSMMEALAAQLLSWGHRPSVYVEAQIERNNELLK